MWKLDHGFYQQPRYTLNMKPYPSYIYIYMPSGAILKFSVKVWAKSYTSA